jgi:hypothetical protein
LPGSSRFSSTNSRSRDERRQRLGQIRALADIVVFGFVRQFCDGPDEAIAAPGQRLDPTFSSGRLRKHAAQRRDLHREIAFFDDDARPRGVHDAGLGDVLIWLLDESGQDRHSAGAQRGRSLVSTPARSRAGNGPDVIVLVTRNRPFWVRQNVRKTPRLSTTESGWNLQQIDT